MKIDLKEIVELDEEKDELEKIIEKIIEPIIEENRILEFFDTKYLESLAETNIPGYQTGKLKILNEEYGIIIKDSLVNALTDPSGNDANLLKEAGKKLNETLKNSYSKKQLKPLESNFEKTVFKSYLSSLLMNLVKYPTDQLNENTLKEIGLYNEDISKLYVNAAAAWLGSNEGIDAITRKTGIISKLEKIGYTGKSDKIDLSVERCYSGSHYVLKFNESKKQIDVQIEVPKISQEYIEIEDVIVSYIVNNTKNPLIKENARNLVRLYLNLTTCYDKNKPLPLDWK